MSLLHIKANGSQITFNLPPDVNPLGFLIREVEKDLVGYGGEDTQIDPGVKVEYTYNEWSVTVERNTP